MSYAECTRYRTLVREVSPSPMKQSRTTLPETTPPVTTPPETTPPETTPPETTPPETTPPETTPPEMTLPQSAPPSWSTAHGTLDFAGVPIVMGVLNVTPDSFSDGGECLDPEHATARADQMVADGVGIIDIGAESTRPGSEPVSADEQIRRLRDVLPEIRRRNPHTPISIDTRLVKVAAFAIEGGADIINDISAFRDDPDMLALARETGAHAILMHMRGKPRTMQKNLDVGQGVDIVEHVLAFLRDRVDALVAGGLSRDKIAIDPGIGFGKTLEQNVSLMGHLGVYVAEGLPVLLGASRKSFLGRLTDCPDERSRVSASLASATVAALSGVQMVRVHDVPETVDAMRIVHAIRTSAASGGR